MKKITFILILLSLISISSVACSPSGSQATGIGLVTDDKNDEEAIKEVVSAYFQAIKNYEWESYDMNDGLEYWTNKGKEEWLSNPNKLPNLKKSIQENEISRVLQESEIDVIEINGDAATVEAITIEMSKSINPHFSGKVQSYESLVLIKNNNAWRITDRSAQVLVIRKE
ncbi:MAG: hypothetical protein CVU87_03135 [Firmicutes bacterium HGW-Firmicutes-12]|jgi:hypothetical protein|nr:MAG: hypothetical protein CVU87_03135 [Firmicutes bacterium HGW-Firmicutes-12]